MEGEEGRGTAGEKETYRERERTFLFDNFYTHQTCTLMVANSSFNCLKQDSISRRKVFKKMIKKTQKFFFFFYKYLRKNLNKV